MKKSLAEKWLWLAVTAIAVAGLYSLVPVIGRTPQLKHLEVAQHLFDVSLVVHVDLSVLVWSLAMLGMGLALTLREIPAWSKAGFYTVAASTALIALSPMGEWTAVKSNYIPVLNNFPFLLGLALLMAGMAITLLPVLGRLSPAKLKAASLTDIGWLAAGLVGLIGLAAYGLSGYLLPEIAELQPRYEMLFWAGGHIMQFAYTLTAMVAWLMLLAATGRPFPRRRLVVLAFVLPVLGAVLSFAGFALQPFGEDSFRIFQTKQMIELGGIGPSLLAVLLISQWLRAPATQPRSAYSNALLVSLLLFFAGGVLGLMISGQNVTIPAHYHGMIVGITQGLMGLAYVMLPRFGYASVAHTRLARWQPIVYGVGQLMHIGGLAYCGGYGILRKTAGGFEHLAPDIKIALGIFGLGGLLAITGGVLFVVVMMRAGLRRGLLKAHV